MESKEKLSAASMDLPGNLSMLQGGDQAIATLDAATIATLEKQLICPICLELFSKPVVILPCQHNLCRKCANELYQPSLLQPRTTMSVHSGRFRCPCCRQEVVLDRHGVFGLQRNLLVENIIDVYKQEVANNNKPLPPAPSSAVGKATCPEHEGEKVNIYCLSCRVPTCSLCKVFGAHQMCQVAPLTDIYQQQKDELREEISSLVTVKDKVQSVINKLEQSCRNIEENCKSQKQVVCEKFDRVFSILQERRKVMTERISSDQEVKTGHAQALVRCLGDKVNGNKELMERAKRSIGEPDMAAFIKDSRELITKVRAASGSSHVETLEPGYEDMSHYTFSFSRQENALKGLDFLKVVEEIPEEPELKKHLEKPKHTDEKHHQETIAQHLESVVETANKESIQALTSTKSDPILPPEPPFQPALLSPVNAAVFGCVVPPVRGSVEATDAFLQTVKSALTSPKSAPVLPPPPPAKPTLVSPVHADVSGELLRPLRGSLEASVTVLQTDIRNLDLKSALASPKSATILPPPPPAQPTLVSPVHAAVSGALLRPVRGTLEASGAVLQTDTQDLGLRMGQIKDKKGEEVEELERYEAPDSTKERIVCEDEDGMSTVQVVTLLFYLFAFLVILQRVWAYIGCFICT